VEIIHTARDNSYETNEGGVEYENTFTAIPAKVPATPHRLTHRPKIEGTQVALVAGPEGEEIHPDQYGRIKLWFPWDRRAKKDGSDTCWVRVAQSWAGAGWGGQIIPRIGMEVMVTHLDGDPDRPLVTGVVPNSRQKVPYKLPENKTKSVFRSNTHKGKGFNEITFEDESGREEIFMRAQKDLTVKVDNHATKRVDANQVVSIGGMSLREIEKSSTENVAQNLSINVGTGALGNIVSGQARQDTFGMRPAGYFLDQSLNEATGSGNFNLDAANSIRMNTATAFSVEVKGVMFTTVGQNHTANVGGSFFTSAGADNREVVGAKKMIDAHGEIHLRCGKSELVMKPDGVITIKGLKLIVDEEEHIDLHAARIDLNK
jgi:type VI secretion system secreted protein VgrG